MEEAEFPEPTIHIGEQWEAQAEDPVAVVSPWGPAGAGTSLSRSPSGPALAIECAHCNFCRAGGTLTCLPSGRRPRPWPSGK